MLAMNSRSNDTAFLVGKGGASRHFVIYCFIVLTVPLALVEHDKKGAQKMFSSVSSKNDHSVLRFLTIVNTSEAPQILHIVWGRPTSLECTLFKYFKAGMHFIANIRAICRLCKGKKLNAVGETID